MQGNGHRGQKLLQKKEGSNKVQYNKELFFFENKEREKNKMFQSTLLKNNCLE